MRWDTGTPKGYGFTYDGLSRLTAADYADGSSFTSNQNRYNTSYGYDANGNLSSLSRYLNATQIDNLTYTYISSGNRLQSVNDATGNPNGYDDNNGTYTYDNNGNLGYDPSKGTYLSYNYLNLPEQVQFGANDNLRYTYDAAGNKLVKVVDGTVSGNNTRLDYSGNFVYENDELKAIFTSAGRIIPFDNNGNIVYKFEYNLQDHLGNTRVVFSGHSNGQPEVMQITDYYPFGLVMNQYNYFASGVLSNKYLYNNKELQDDELAGNSLGWYDYGARFYDPELGRWHSVDPLAEEAYDLTPYRYGFNNPISFTDPTGMLEDWVEKEDKTIYWDENAISQETTKEGETYLGKAVVVFNGSTSEKLGEGQNLYGEGADLADVTVYGPNGKSDVKNYKGFTMSSDSKKFGVVADGRYTVNRLSSDERKGPYGSDLILESRIAEIPALNDFNPAHPDRKPGYLEGVFIHRSNNNGWAGTFLNENSEWHGVSQGCLLIAPKQWDVFKKQLMPVNSFPLIINRK